MIVLIDVPLWLSLKWKVSVNDGLSTINSCGVPCCISLSTSSFLSGDLYEPLVSEVLLLVIGHGRVTLTWEELDLFLSIKFFELLVVCKKLSFLLS